MYTKIKIGFSAYYTIPASETHKAYWLFTHPEQRGIFSNGVAVRGQDILGVEPDFHATMGWNPEHKLNEDDMNELAQKGIDKKMRMVLSIAKEVARIATSEQLNTKLSDVAQKLNLIEHGIHHNPALRTGGETKSIRDALLAPRQVQE